MADRDFIEWLGSFRESINTYKYYTDFQKVYANIDDIKIELNLMNSLIGSKNIEQDFIRLATRYPEVLHAIPILIAKRESEIYCQDENGGVLYNFKTSNIYDIESIVYFMNETGLFDLISKHIINNLVDYVMGVEVGLDSNGRKNRGGHQMEDLLEMYIKMTGKEYYKEMNASEVECMWNVDLSSLTNEGSTAKRWDFVVKTQNDIYLFETNFYASGGSKLNETARSYKMIATEAKELDNIHFIWVTDGKGWKSAKNNLKETFDVLDDLYNITDLENGVLKKVLK